MAFDLGGRVAGSSQSVATQGATVQFIPSVTESGAGPWVSSYPAGQGLATINSALPNSAAWNPINYASATAPASSPSLTTSLLFVAAIGAAAWFLLRKKGRR